MSPARRWSQLGLDGRYVVASLPVLLLAMLGLGAWVTRNIEDQVIENTAGNASLFVNSFVSPELQLLSGRSYLTEDERRRLGSLLSDTPLGRRVLSFKVWMAGGRVVYYSRDSGAAGVFEPGAKLRQAWTGKVAAELLSLPDEESAAELKLGVPLLEVYMPVHERGSTKVIAVAEFYQDASELSRHLATTRLRTWLVVAVVMLGMYGLLFGIVHAGGRLIRSQDRQLRERVSDLSALLSQNEGLRERVGRASRRITELNEAFLSRLSADLHDGPAQALSLALLRLDEVAGDKAGELEQIRNRLQDALKEIRELSRGLSLPELADLSITQVLERASTDHERRTRTAVELDIGGLDRIEAISVPIKLTVYRFVQEALMNAFRHAGGKGQAVSAREVGKSLEVRVSDRGGGMRADAAAAEFGERMGLTGLRERVEVLGGRFRVESEAQRGTSVLAVLPLS